MRVTVQPGSRISGDARVPGDKSIAHRLLILAATATGPSRILGLPRGLDIVATMSVLGSVAPPAAPGLERWLHDPQPEGAPAVEGARASDGDLRVEGEGRGALRGTHGRLDCANSGTTMRLLSGVLAGAPFRSVLSGDASLLRRPMERVARPLRAMGARVSTTDGAPPVEIDGAALTGIDWSTEVPSAQVKGAILLAGLVADGATTVRESAPTRDHTERLLEALGAAVQREEGSVTIRAFQHDGFEGAVPGDISSAAFLLGAAAVTGGAVTIGDVGLNPTRTSVLDALRRMGVRASAEQRGVTLGEPFGVVSAVDGERLIGVEVGVGELPLVIDEVPVLAAVAAHATGETRFRAAGELRVKASDRLTAIADGLRELGGEATVEGDDLVVAGGGLHGGRTSARGDHRLAMGFAVAALGAEGPCVIDGVDSAAVSFPGFSRIMSSLGAELEVTS